MDSAPQPSTLGRVLREKRAGGFRCLEVRHDAGVQLAPHSHRYPSLCCVLDGGFEEWMDGASYRAEPASVLVEPAGVDHASDFRRGATRSLILEIESPALARRLDDLGAPLGEPNMLRSPEVARLGHLLAEELQLDDRASWLAAEGLALELVACATRLQGVGGETLPPAWLLGVREQVRAQFRDSPPLERLARDAGVHPVHLARAFRRHFGESVGAHARRLQLDWCAERLGRSDEAVAEIALQAGFCDQSHLARHFRRLFGCTPGQYRRARRSR